MRADVKGAASAAPTPSPETHEDATQLVITKGTIWSPEPAPEGHTTGWIDVNDRLPGEQGHDSEEVSVFLNGHCGLLDNEKRNGGGWGYRTGWYDAERGCFRVHGCPDSFVTHWQPLPAPPATTEGQSNG